jgi:hypothetical protein
MTFQRMIFILLGSLQWIIFLTEPVDDIIDDRGVEDSVVQQYILIIITNIIY